MTLEEIKSAVLAGKKVCWISSLYEVVQDRHGQWLTICSANRDAIGLTHQDGVTMNGDPEDFFILED